jgi:hypothetical protein
VADGIPAEAEAPEEVPVFVGPVGAGQTDRGEVGGGVRGGWGVWGARRAHRGHRHGVSAEASGRAMRARAEAVPS